jgi:CheY-like chemotaxis protein
MKRTLVVEDEFEIAESVKLILDEEGYETYIAYDGVEAMELLKKIPLPHLILSDVMMPKMDGYQFLKRLQDEEKFRKIPIVFMSAGKPRNETLQDSWSGFLKKPFNIDDLINLVSRASAGTENHA